MKSIVMLFLSLLPVSVLAENPYAVESAIYKVVVPVGNSNYFGTGVLLSPDRILTNCHIVQGKGGWPKVMQRKTGDWFKVAKYYQLGKLDACVLVGGFRGQPVAPSAKIVEGENIWLYGYPSGIPVIGQGSVLGYADGGKTLKLGAFCSGGSSGGPVLNARGELIGLNFAVYRYQKSCLAIPVIELRPYL
ncbi:S1 family peptidase [Azonexus hydrophilus]|uniref:S1 family peptidase n=1 Tax=Azonexus hydrophilus TaxID=418702 RepID=UPI0004914BAF|nr:serine protease [Azonexus hydrophilus]